VAYLLIDIKRLQLGSRALVTAIEESIVTLLASLGLATHSDPEAPGVYVGQHKGEQRKIASLGLRIRRGASYHGLALNRDMELAPWQRINPCGHQGQAVTSLTAEGVVISRNRLESQLSALIADRLGLHIKAGDAPDWYNDLSISTSLPQGSHA
jgi:lipoyl(octanoyl) transferase